MAREASERHILALNEEGLLAEVLGYETREVASQARGTEVDTLSGEHFIDFTGGIAVHACGHNHPEVVQAVRDQAQDVLHTSDVLRHAPATGTGRVHARRLSAGSARPALAVSLSQQRQREH